MGVTLQQHLSIGMISIYNYQIGNTGRSLKTIAWIYANYVVLQKQAQQLTFDPLKDIVQYWHVNKQTLLAHYNLIYANDKFGIFKRK